MPARPPDPSPARLSGRALDERNLADVGPLAHDADRGVLISRRARIVGAERDGRLRRELLGALFLPSGQILACDPTYEDFTGAPFSREVRPGRYPVVLTRHRDGPEETGGGIAAAALIFRDEQPVAWELATSGDQRLADLGPGEIFGYGVDGGTGCFLDAEVAEVFGTGHHARLRKAYERGGYEPFVYTLRDEPAVAVFTSGDGDGFYASYWGLDGRGEPVCLVTDFGLLTDAVRVRLRFGEDGGLRVAALEHPALTHVGAAVRLTELSPERVALTITGAVSAVEGQRLLARRGDAWEPVAAATQVTWTEREATYALLPTEPEAGPLALELGLVVGVSLARAEEEPQAKSPVLRRRRT